MGDMCMYEGVCMSVHCSEDDIFSTLELGMDFLHFLTKQSFSKTLVFRFSSFKKRSFLKTTFWSDNLRSKKIKTFPSLKKLKQIVIKLKIILSQSNIFF